MKMKNSLKVYLLIYVFEFVNVIVKSENGTCKQKCLPYIEQKTVCHIINVNDLVCHQRNTRENKRHGANVLNFLCGCHSPKPMLCLRRLLRRLQGLTECSPLL